MRLKNREVGYSPATSRCSFKPLRAYNGRSRVIVMSPMEIRITTRPLARLIFKVISGPFKRPVLAHWPFSIGSGLAMRGTRRGKGEDARKVRYLRRFLLVRFCRANSVRNFSGWIINIRLKFFSSDEVARASHACQYWNWRGPE